MTGNDDCYDWWSITARLRWQLASAVTYCRHVFHKRLTCYRTHSTAKFPELVDAIAKPQATDHHFANLLGQHDAVDTEITKSETVTLISDDALETLKKQRLHLKDQLYAIASRAA